MVDSPFAALSYVVSDEQSYRLFFQSAHGDIKESEYDGTNGTSSNWLEAVYVIIVDDLFIDHSNEHVRPIFTDAVNNTGLAVVTYMNGTSLQVWWTLYLNIGISVLTRCTSPAYST